MDKVWDFIQNGLIQGVLGLITVGAIVYLAIVGQPIPEALAGTAGVVVGFYFGGKAQEAIVRARAK